jgi:hypothetical protein
MASPDNLVVMYKELADWHERQAQPQTRDRFLVLAADAALSAGRSAEADLLLMRLLRSNPHHMLRPYSSFANAMASPDVTNYVAELRRTYPPEQAEELFDAMRAGRGAARQTRALPPLEPVEDDGTPPTGASREPLKVYRVQDEAEAKPAGRPAKPAAPRQAAPPPKPLPPRPVRPSPLLAGGPVGPTPQLPPSAADAEEAGHGSWLSTSLFVIVMAAAVALAFWSLFGPFFPRG